MNTLRIVTDGAIMRMFLDDVEIKHCSNFSLKASDTAPVEVALTLKVQLQTGGMPVITTEQAEPPDGA